MHFRGKRKSGHAESETGGHAHSEMTGHLPEMGGHAGLKYALGEMSGSTKANIEQESLNFLNNTLMPWLRRHEEAMERDFLTLGERLSGLTIRYDTKDLLRGDTAARYSSYSVGIAWGFLSPNDARHAENLPPIAGGDRYLEPLNMMAKNDILNQSTEQKATNGKNAQTN